MPQLKKKLPYRVTVSKHGRRWRWTCPAACPAARLGNYETWAHAYRRALVHAAVCAHLRSSNWRTLRCWNCRGRRTVNDGDCVVCLGQGWTHEPEPHTGRSHRA